jgi:hypothetical protein
MVPALTGRDIRRAFDAPFEDPDWATKIAIGTGLLWLGIVIPFIPGLAYQGYLVRYMRPLLRGEAPTLPEWGKWGEALVDGLRVWLVGWMVRLPYHALLLFSLLALASVPLAIPVWIEHGPTTPSFWIALPFLGMTGFGAGVLGAGLVGLVTGVVSPVIIAHVIARDQFGASLRLAEWWGVFRARPGTFVLIYVVMAACSLGLTVLAQLLSASLILCWVVPLALSPLKVYLGLVSTTLFAWGYCSAAPGPLGKLAAGRRRLVIDPEVDS